MHELHHHVLHAGDAPTQRTDPWRRTSGTHDVRTPRGLAVVRELWQERDALAQKLDKSPGRILNDRAISGIAARRRASICSATPICAPRASMFTVTPEPELPPRP